MTQRPGPAAAGSRAATVREEGTDLASRAAQVVMAALLAVMSALIMVTTHRVTTVVGGVHVPTGLILGAILQIACCVFLVATTGRRLGLVVLALVWCLVAMPFAGQSAGGGVIMPAELGGRPQVQGWVVQILGIGIPLLVLAAMWIARIRRLAAERPRRGGTTGPRP